jgi:tryptophan synthase alpha subunit
LFDGSGNFHGVYSSVTAVHRDALKICNQGNGHVMMEGATGSRIPSSVTALRNTLKGAFDVQVVYSDGISRRARIIKTKLKE